MGTEMKVLNALDQYLHEVRRIPRVTLEEEIECFLRIERAKGDQRCIEEAQHARKRLVEAFQRLVITIAKAYWVQNSTNLALLDLIQEGNIGLLRAIERHRVQHGTRFGALARVYVRSAIRDACGTADGRGLPVYKGRLMNYIRVLSSQAEHIQADKYELYHRYIEEVQEFATEGMVSLEQQQERFEDALIGSHDLYGVVAAEQHRLTKLEMLVQHALEALPSDQRQVIQLRYNFLSSYPDVGVSKRIRQKATGPKRTAPVSQGEVAQAMGKSLSWIQMREHRALQTLQNILTPILLHVA